MHINKSLVPLLAFGAFALSMLQSSAQAPTVIASTNYVASGCRLTATGSGFATNEYINVFVNGPRVPITEIMTDSNGSFFADITYNGPYCSTNVQYRFNGAVEGLPCLVNAYYQAAEAPSVKRVGIAYSEFTNSSGPLMVHVRITARVGASGAYYELFTSPNLAGPWQPMNMVKNNDTIADQDLIWDFATVKNTNGNGFFLIGKPRG